MEREHVQADARMGIDALRQTNMPKRYGLAAVAPDLMPAVRMRRARNGLPKPAKPDFRPFI